MNCSASSPVVYGTSVQLGVRVPGDQQRHFLFPVRRDRAARPCSLSLKGSQFRTQPKGRTRDFSDEELALIEPRHIAPEYVPWAN